MITVYSKPACVQCTATYRALDKAGIRYEIAELTEVLLTRFKDEGHMQAPVVVAGDLVFSGFRPDLINEIKETA